MKPKILVIEDDQSYSSLIERILQDNDFASDHVPDADRALTYLKTYRPDVLLLDLNLPGLSGLQLCEILRKDAGTADLPILMLTVKSGERDRVRGLETGADDYLIKPFAPKELIARLRALLRRVRRGQGNARVLSARGIEVDLERHEVRVDGRKMDLRPKEYDLLVIFLERQGHVLSPQTLADTIWGFDATVTRHTLSEHIKNLRQKLGDRARFIETVQEAGYKFSDAD